MLLKSELEELMDDDEKDTKYKLDLTISAIIVLSVSKLIPLPVK